jgi:N-dimethylarginine dimethylaminohydrolase
MIPGVGSQSLVAPLRRVIVKRPEEAFRSPGKIDEEWRRLGFTGPPDLDRAVAEHRRLVALLQEAGAEVLYLPLSEGTTLDSLYAHDPALVSSAGVVVFNMGKPERRGEGEALRRALTEWGVPILGTLEGDATAEGGDMLWLDERTLVAGRGFRTNGPGIARIRALLAPLGIETIEVHLPAWDGRDGLLHLLSVISPLAEDLAVVYRRLLPVPLVELLEARGVTLVGVPDEEFAGMACNVLALAPRRVVMLEGLPVTRGRLEAAGCAVAEYSGREISLKGNGGPTCLTRPLLRSA